MEEANEFIAELDPKTIKKKITILTLLNRRMTRNCSKNCKMTSGNFGQNLQDFELDFLHFGTRLTKKKLWLLQHTGSLKRLTKYQQTKLTVQ